MHSKLVVAVLVSSAVLSGGCASSVRHYTDRRPITITARRPAPVVAVATPRIERIDVEESIFFHNGSARIRPESFPVIEEVARIIERNPEIGRVRVEGHTDRAGNARFNRRLSQRRADAVRLRLIRNGIPAERLESVGYGDEQPVADNETRLGRTLNRRVEFVVVETDGDA